jgi:NAD-dependent deacetylase
MFEQMSSPLDMQLQRAAAALAAARRVVVLTGAGVSAESGISTFRDADTGLWSRFDPMRLASQEGFAENPALVWQWYMERLGVMERAQPNPGHLALAELERLAPEFVLATQNVDDLHERAGSRHVLHLHGLITRYLCNLCGAPHAITPTDRRRPRPPLCPSCGAPIRPGVVWFGEMLPERILDQAYRSARRCDVLLIVGTSGVVYPVAHLPHMAKSAGAHVIEQNLQCDAYQQVADVQLEGRGGILLPQLVEAVKRLRAEDAQRA